MGGDTLFAKPRDHVCGEVRAVVVETDKRAVAFEIYFRERVPVLARRDKRVFAEVGEDRVELRAVYPPVEDLHIAA